MAVTKGDGQAPGARGAAARHAGEQGLLFGEEIAELAPNVEVMRQWKGPEHMPAAIDRVTQFLDRHTPR